MQLSKKGFDSHSAPIENPQGFGLTHSDTVSSDRFELAIKGGSFVPSVLFKYHAACFLTHSSLEAVRLLMKNQNIRPESIQKVIVNVDAGHFSVCNIQEPKSGIEAKFSLRCVIAMTLAGIDTACVDSFSDKTVNRQDVIKLRDRIFVEAFQEPRPESKVALFLSDGRSLVQEFNSAIPEKNQSIQWTKLKSKFSRLVVPVFGQERSNRIIDTIRNLEDLEDVSNLMELVS
jgi:2-methylcitrate dehydratase PrpD